MGGASPVNPLGPDGVAERMARIDARMDAIMPRPQNPAFTTDFRAALGTATKALPPSGDVPLDPSLLGPNPLSGPIGGGSDLRAMAQTAAERHGLDPHLFNALVEQESGWNPQATSRVGAKGLCQLMDGTAGDLGVRDPYDPAQSLEGGARYLRMMLDRNGGDPVRALASYNAGFGRVNGRSRGEWPAETQAYVSKILANADRGRVG